MLPAEIPRINFARMVPTNLPRFACVNCSLEMTLSVTLDCGHKVCMHCFWKKSSSSTCCNKCWEYSRLKTLQHDLVMHPEGEGMCEIHQEEQKLFCDWDRTLLCMTCSKSEEHKYHILWPIAVAALQCRKHVESHLRVLDGQLKKLQKWQKLADKKRPLSWVVECSDYRDVFTKTFDENLQVVLKYMKGKEKKSEKEELLLEKIKEKFNELYQKLKETEAIQERKILEQKKEWEAKKVGEIRFLTDHIAELKEKSQKPDVEILQNETELLYRSVREYCFEPFIPRVDAFYLLVVADFLKFYHRFKLLENCNYYDLADDKERTILIRTDSSGNTSTIYTTGPVKAEVIKKTQLLTLWSHKKIVDKEGCVRIITTRSDFP